MESNTLRVVTIDIDESIDYIKSFAITKINIYCRSIVTILLSLTQFFLQNELLVVFSLMQFYLKTIISALKFNIGSKLSD